MCRGRVPIRIRGTKRGWLSKVDDRYGYWEQRDEQKLLERTDDSLAELAAFTGALKDKLAGSHAVSNPILEHPDFKHREAKGLQEPDS